MNEPAALAPAQIAKLTLAQAYHTVSSVPESLSLAERAALLEKPPTIEAHGTAVQKQEILRRIEVHRRPDRSAENADDTDKARSGEPWLNVAFWNAERCKYVDASAALLGSIDADIILLAEMDLGMARSGQIHTTAELAAKLNYSYIFAPEFIELGLGDARERKWFNGQQNEAGLHGAAILSRVPVADPLLIRLPETGEWFDGSRGERRIGGRIVLALKTQVGSQTVVVASAHLESHGGPDSRAAEMTSFLPVLEEYSNGSPVLLGGDFNTNSTDRDVANWEELRAQLVSETPARLSDPVAYEPMFTKLSAAGYGWRDENAPGTTQRTRPDGTPAPPFAKLDWFFGSGLDVSSPKIVPAVAPGDCHGDGLAISDHDVLTLLVRPNQRFGQSPKTEQSK